MYSRFHELPLLLVLFVLISFMVFMVWLSSVSPRPDVVALPADRWLCSQFLIEPLPAAPAIEKSRTATTTSRATCTQYTRIERAAP